MILNKQWTRITRYEIQCTANTIELKVNRHAMQLYTVCLLAVYS